MPISEGSKFECFGEFTDEILTLSRHPFFFKKFRVDRPTIPALARAAGAHAVAETAKMQNFAANLREQMVCVEEYEHFEIEALGEEKLGALLK
jgi:hypothetical protein